MATTSDIGNGTITITQGGATKGSFSTNQSGNTTIELADNNTTYSAGRGLSLFGTTFNIVTNYPTSAADRNYAIKADSTTNALYVNVPWVEYSAGAGIQISSGIINVGLKYHANGDNFAVKEGAGGLYVNVPVSNYLPLSGGTMADGEARISWNRNTGGTISIRHELDSTQDNFTIVSYRPDGLRGFSMVDGYNQWTHCVFNTSSFPFGADRSFASEE